MATRGKDNLARKQPEPQVEPEQKEPENIENAETANDTDADWPVGFPGRSETENRPNFYREIGLKERTGEQTIGLEKFKNEPPAASMVDKSDADAHQKEGPGGKG